MIHAENVVNVKVKNERVYERVLECVKSDERIRKALSRILGRSDSDLLSDDFWKSERDRIIAACFENDLLPSKTLDGFSSLQIVSNDYCVIQLYEDHDYDGPPSLIFDSEFDLMNANMYHRYAVYFHKKILPWTEEFPDDVRYWDVFNIWYGSHKHVVASQADQAVELATKMFNVDFILYKA